MDWQVCIPAGRWMAGVNHFRNKAKAEAFIRKWNQVEVNSGNSSLCFARVPKTRIYRAEA
jgi:hypothetical protein